VRDVGGDTCEEFVRRGLRCQLECCKGEAYRVLRGYRRERAQSHGG
jgi:hypothetical protein